ncbi:MAG: histidine triad nucleotide-binding protein [Chloroflexi bacterium]|nr:histidine triad nucleotide-binding protein [Chloroflexota bacterium]
MKPDCLFCKIAGGQLQADIVYEDDDVVAFKDVNPQAPVHILIIPRRHIPAIAELEEADGSLVGKLVVTAKKLAATMGLNDKGFRLVFNNGFNAGQEVFHIHLHLLGGRKFIWPPG